LGVGRADSLSVVEAAYARAPNEEAWLERVAHAIAENLDGELGAAGWLIDFLPGVAPKTRDGGRAEGVADGRDGKGATS
jgi:hypothetical protein